MDIEKCKECKSSVITLTGIVLCCNPLGNIIGECKVFIKKIKCLMLERCRKATGINCDNRDYTKCEFFIKLNSEKKGKYYHARVN